MEEPTSPWSPISPTPEYPKQPSQGKCSTVIYLTCENVAAVSYLLAVSGAGRLFGHEHIKLELQQYGTDRNMQLRTLAIIEELVGCYTGALRHKMAPAAFPGHVTGPARVNDLTLADDDAIKVLLNDHRIPDEEPSAELQREAATVIEEAVIRFYRVADRAGPLPNYLQFLQANLGKGYIPHASHCIQAAAGPETATRLLPMRMHNVALFEFELAGPAVRTPEEYVVLACQYFNIVNSDGAIQYGHERALALCDEAFSAGGAPDLFSESENNCLQILGTITGRTHRAGPKMPIYTHQDRALGATIWKVASALAAVKVLCCADKSRFDRNVTATRVDFTILFYAKCLFHYICGNKHVVKYVPWIIHAKVHVRMMKYVEESRFFLGLLGDATLAGAPKKGMVRTIVEQAFYNNDDTTSTAQYRANGPVPGKSGRCRKMLVGDLLRYKVACMYEIHATRALQGCRNHSMPALPLQWTKMPKDEGATISLKAAKVDNANIRAESGFVYRRTGPPSKAVAPWKPEETDSDFYNGTSDCTATDTEEDAEYGEDCPVVAEFRGISTGH